MSFLSDNPTLATAVLAALAGVVSKGLFDHWVQAKRLRFERDNVIQQKFLDAQWALLDELGTICWKFRYDAIRVAYYWQKSQPHEYKAAVDNYVANCWTTLNKIRFFSTQAGYLFSKDALDTVEKFYKKVEYLDEKIEEAIAEKNIETRKSSFDKIFPKVEKDLREQIADLIMDLAKQPKLTPRK